MQARRAISVMTPTVLNRLTNTKLAGSQPLKLFTHNARAPMEGGQRTARCQHPEPMPLVSPCPRLIPLPTLKALACGKQRFGFAVRPRNHKTGRRYSSCLMIYVYMLSSQMLSVRCFVILESCLLILLKSSTGSTTTSCLLLTRM